MSRRAVRIALVALLISIGIGAGMLMWSVERRVRALDATEREVTGDIDRLIAGFAELISAQAGYVAPGQPSQPWFDRVSEGIPQLTTLTDALRQRTRSVEAAPRLQALADAIARLTQMDKSARDAIATEDSLTASVLVFGDARHVAESSISSLRHLRDAESNAFLMQREAVVEQSWLMLAGAGAIWVVGLLLLVPLPTATAAPDTALLPRDAADDPAVTPPPASTIDMAAAADLCTAISRVTAEQALPDLLARAATLLDAAGVIVWMSAGEELFAVTAHGYDARMLARMGAISLSADNATAAAWRTGEIRTVAGDATTNGAIIAPLFGPTACIGVLTAEVRHGREGDASTRAVTAMLAAQLATAVAAWPAPSASQTKAG